MVEAISRAGNPGSVVWLSLRALQWKRARGQKEIQNTQLEEKMSSRKLSVVAKACAGREALIQEVIPSNTAATSALPC